MKVIKILNNNLVFARDDNGREVIVKGLGIGFHASRGDTVDESRIGQVFYPQEKQNIQQIQEFLLSIPAEYLNFVQDFVDSIKAAEGITFNSSIYLSLSDHLLGTIKRYQEGISLENVLLLDIKRLYKKEYTWGEQMLAQVKKVFGVTLPSDEAGFIALHFVNAEENQSGNDSYKIAAIVSDIQQTVKNYYSDLEFDDNSLYYQRFLTHLKYFVQRYPRSLWLCKDDFPHDGGTLRLPVEPGRNDVSDHSHPDQRGARTPQRFPHLIFVCWHRGPGFVRPTGPVPFP